MQSSAPKCAIPCIKLEDELTWLNNFISTVNLVLKYCAKDSPGIYVPIITDVIVGTTLDLPTSVVMQLIYAQRYGWPSTLTDFDPVLLQEIYNEYGVDFVN